MEQNYCDSPFSTPFYSYSAFPYWENYYDYSNTALFQDWNLMTGFTDTPLPPNPSFDASPFWCSPNSAFSESPGFTPDFSSYMTENSPQTSKTPESCSEKSENSKNPRSCTNCQTTKTCRWRNVTTQVLCNACFVYTRKYHKPRPSSAVIAYQSRVQSDGKMKNSRKTKKSYSGPY